jgi:hypothetical protein
VLPRGDAGQFGAQHGEEDVRLVPGREEEVGDGPRADGVRRVANEHDGQVVCAIITVVVQPREFPCAQAMTTPASKTSTHRRAHEQAGVRTAGGAQRPGEVSVEAG